jgi:hypothetical protein
LLLVSFVGAFWFIARMPPRETVFPSIPLDPPRAKEPWQLSPTDPILSMASGLGTASVLGISIAMHRWPDALVLSLNLIALVVLFAFQVWANEERDNEFLRSSTSCGRSNGLACTVLGLSLHKPLGHVQLALLLFFAMVLLGSIWWDTRRQTPVHA